MIVDKGVVSELGFKFFSLHIAAGQADDSASAHQFGDLTGNIANGPACGGNHNGFARPGLANIGQTKVGGHPGITQNTEVEVLWRIGILMIEHDKKVVASKRVLLPSQTAHDKIALFERCVATFCNHANRQSHDRLTKRHSRQHCVTGIFIHPVSKARIHRNVLVLNEGFAVLGAGHNGSNGFKIGRHRRTIWAALKQNLRVVHCCDLPWNPLCCGQPSMQISFSPSEIIAPRFR